ncbi:MAG TPA: efflux RND transporter periplasmic adaptor subunit [Gemmatimonadaceae bacterium]|nr:efflux RND transporter periplasmic adaptor subunit [Gemmatimonadaceae bacterium]
MADTMTVQQPIELPAQLYVEHDAVVVARSAGTIDSVSSELGDRVSSGQLLARLESAEQEIALAGAEAAHDNASRAVTRARALTKSGGITQADSEQAEFQLRQMEIAVRKARRDVDLTRITAPFAGVVTSRAARPRRFVAAGDTLFRVTEQTPLLARIHVPESSASGIRVGESATVVSGTGTAVGAVVAHAAPFVDAASGTREIVLRLLNPGSGEIVGGSVMVRLGRNRRRAIVVDRTAIAPEGYVVVVENGRSTVRPVTLGRDVGGGRVEVVSGLSAGERLARPNR